jgi:hypothetical protein
MIYDPVLGLFNYALQFGVLIYFAHAVLKAGIMHDKEMPNMIPNFWFRRLDFNEARNQSFGSFPYCMNSTRYHYASDETNDDKLKCKQSMFDDIVSQEPDRAYVMTFEKFQSARTTDCSEQNNCASAHPQSTVLNDGNPFVIQESKGDYSCTCIEVRNFIPISPESIGLGIHHAFETSPKFGGGLRGSTAVPGKKSSPITTIRRKAHFDGSDGKTQTEGPPPLVFQPGKPISVSVKQLLDFAFAKDPDAPDYVSPLDQRTSQHDDYGVQQPFRRLSGVTLDLDFVYHISTNQEGGVQGQVECDLEVSYSEGMVSWMPPIQITNQRDIDHETSVRRDYTTIVKRGVLIRMHAKGQVSQFNIYNLVDALVQLVVLLPLASTVVIYFAIYAPQMLNPRQAIYKAAVKEELDYDREMSKFAATAALATAQFDQWCVPFAVVWRGVKLSLCMVMQLLLHVRPASDKSPFSLYCFSGTKTTMGNSTVTNSRASLSVSTLVLKKLDSTMRWRKSSRVRSSLLLIPTGANH